MVTGTVLALAECAFRVPFTFILSFPLVFLLGEDAIFGFMLSFLVIVSCVELISLALSGIREVGLAVVERRVSAMWGDTFLFVFFFVPGLVELEVVDSDDSPPVALAFDITERVLRVRGFSFFANRTFGIQSVFIHWLSGRRAENFFFG